MRLPSPLLAGTALLALSAASLAARAEPITFGPTSVALPGGGAIQTFNVSTTGLYDIVAIGAGGGGSLGARIEDRFSLTAGEVLSIVVGVQGSGGITGSSGSGGSFRRGTR